MDGAPGFIVRGRLGCNLAGSKEQRRREGASGVVRFRVGLEVQLHGQLGLACRSRTRDTTEGASGIPKNAIVPGGSRVGELRMVEDVVAFHSELEADSRFGGKVEVLGQDHVGIVDSRAVSRIAMDIAKDTERLVGKARFGNVRIAGAVSNAAHTRIALHDWGDLVWSIGAGIEVGVEGAPIGIGTTARVGDIEREAGGGRYDAADLPA